MLAGPSPEALIGPIASATERIRVGSGGVMLPHYSPFKVAETFSLLAGLYPGRIDLALGRAAGTDPMTTFALQRDRRAASPDDFPQQLSELLGYLDDSLPADPPFPRLHAGASGTTDRDPAARPGRALPRRSGAVRRARRGRAARAAGLTADGRHAAAGGGGRVWRRGGDRRVHHLRARGPAAQLRAARGGLRALRPGRGAAVCSPP